MSAIKLLIIDDDPNICELVKLYGEKNGYAVIIAYDGLEGLQKVYDEQPDLVVLDLMLPEMDGWNVCEQIREDYDTPIIMLTGRGESYEKIRGLEIGADDYLVKPFDPHELMARIKAVLRRMNPGLFDHEPLTYGTLMIDIMQYELQYLGRPIAMPRKELELLYYLASHPNRVFTRQQLLDQVWGYDYAGDPRTVDVHIKRIREKVGQETPEWRLKTIRGIGYKFEVKT